MGLGLFARNRKPGHSGLGFETFGDVHIDLRVLVDSGPANRELFTIRVPVYEHVNVIRQAIAEHIGISSMSLFKVSIPWKAYYEAASYTQRYEVPAPLLSSFDGYNLDDEGQLVSLRRRSKAPSSRHSSGVTPSPACIRDWFPDGGDCNAIEVVARTTSSSSLDWKQRPLAPLTLVARFASMCQAPATPRRHTIGQTSGSRYSDQTRTSSPPLTLIDISPDSSVADLKVALLISAGRPAPVALLDSVVVYRVEMSENEIEAVDLRDGLSQGKAPTQKSGRKPILLSDNWAPVSRYFSSHYRSNSRLVSLSVWIDPRVADAFVPRASYNSAPRFEYPMPSVDDSAPRSATVGRAHGQRLREPLDSHVALQAALEDAESPNMGVSSVYPSPTAPSAATMAITTSVQANTERGRVTAACCMGFCNEQAHGFQSSFPSLSGGGRFPSLNSDAGGLFAGGGLIGLGISFGPAGSDPLANFGSPAASTCSEEENDDDQPSWPPTPYLSDEGCDPSPAVAQYDDDERPVVHIGRWGATPNLVPNLLALNLKDVPTHPESRSAIARAQA